MGEGRREREGERFPVSPDSHNQFREACCVKIAFISLSLPVLALSLMLSFNIKSPAEWGIRTLQKVQRATRNPL